MDGAILVVAATDGCMPQTREHLLLAKQVTSRAYQLINNYFEGPTNGIFCYLLLSENKCISGQNKEHSLLLTGLN